MITIVKELERHVNNIVSTFSVKIIIRIFVFILAVLSSSIAPISHAAAATVINGIADKCLDVQGGESFATNKVQLYTCNATIAQQWERPNDGTVRNQGFCLDVQWDNKSPGTSVWLYDCNGSSAQQWTTGNGGSLVSLSSKLCLDDRYGGTNDSNPIWVYSCNATASQKWTSALPITASPNIPTVDATPSSTAGAGYTNVDNNHVASPSSSPSGATAQCADGTYSYSQHRSGTCSHHGGVTKWL